MTLVGAVTSMSHPPPAAVWGGGAVKCPGGAELPHPHPTALGGVKEEEEEEKKALLPPINSLPCSPRCHSLFLLLHVQLTRRPHVPGPGVG